MSNYQVVKYLQSGPNILPVHELIPMQKELMQSTDPNTTRKPSTLLVAAETCIDIAMQVDQSSYWIEKAETQLDSIIEEIHCKRDARNYSYFAKYSQTLTNTYIRKAEINNWNIATNNQKIENDYPQMLRTGRLILDICKQNFEGVRGRAIEFVPLLLGSRAQYKNMNEQWSGRTSLLREDASIVNKKGIKDSWDVGVNFNNTNTSFLSPELLLQTAASCKKGVRKYEDVGIYTLLAKNYKFEYPCNVIAGCLREVDCSVILAQNTHAYSTDELDDISGSLYTNFVQLRENKLIKSIEKS